MRIIPTELVKSMHGRLMGMNNPWHVRTNQYGTIFLARNGHPQKNPTAKQLAHQERMREAVARYQEIIADAEQLAEWNKKLTNQTRYKNLRALVIASVLRGAVII